MFLHFTAPPNVISPPFRDNRRFKKILDQCYWQYYLSPGFYDQDFFVVLGALTISISKAVHLLIGFFVICITLQYWAQRMFAFLKTNPST